MQGSGRRSAGAASVPDKVAFEDLPEADLVVDQVYAGGTSGTFADDPLARLLPVGNQGGFRYFGSPRAGTVRLAVLFTTGSVVDWPDALDPQSGIFTYYGDNRSPGRELHNTVRAGNLLLRDVFAWAHSDAADRARVPPFLLFESAGAGRHVRFRGLLAPGGATLTTDSDLVAIWRSTGGLRFQNYRALFTVLDEPKVHRAWIVDMLTGQSTASEHCPSSWRRWVANRHYAPLISAPTKVVRSRAEQLPPDPAGRQLLDVIRDYYRARPHEFEACAVAIWRLLAPATGPCELTPPTRDGGRDAIGGYILGPPADPISIDFALEAKCYGEDNSVGVREVSRLISRLRHRHFGVFVTTSFFGQQVYDEVRTDQHPIALICGRDIVDVLRANGRGDAASVRAWLDALAPEPR